MIWCLFSSSSSWICAAKRHQNRTLPAHNTANNDTRSFDIAIRKLSPQNSCAPAKKRRSTTLYEIVDRLVERAGVPCRAQFIEKRGVRHGHRRNDESHSVDSLSVVCADVIR